MENLFTRNELIFLKVVGWAIAIIVPAILYRWNSKELKESEKSQGKRIDDLWKKLQEEVIARKDSERKTVEKNVEAWKSSYYQEREQREKDWKKFEARLKELDKKITKLERERRNLRNQLWEKGVPWEEHDIDDEDQQLEIIVEVKGRWGAYQNKDEKINEQTIEEMLGNWENRLKNKKGKEILKERERLLKKIQEEAKLAKNKHD